MTSPDLSPPSDPTVRPAVSPRLAALDGASAAEVEQFWGDVSRNGAPLVEPAEDGHIVTFVYRSADPDARVLLVGNRIGDRSERSEQLLTRLPGTDILQLSLRMRSDHRATYTIAADTGPIDGAGPELQEQLTTLAAKGRPDPLCPDRLPQRWTGGEVSVFALPDAPAPLARSSSVSAPATRSVRWPGSGEIAARELHNSVIGDSPRTLLVLTDGDFWIDQMQVHRLLAGAVAAGDLPPLAVIAPDAIDLQHRWSDLSANRDFVDELLDSMVPHACAELGITAERVIVAGQSLGGLTALATALWRPDRVDAVIAQSPSLWWRPGVSRTGEVPGAAPTAADQLPWLAESIPDGLPVQVRIDVGLQEGGMVDHARSMTAALAQRGAAVELTEFNGGHDYACWEVALLSGLARLLAQ